MESAHRFDPDLLTPLLDRARSLAFVSLVRRLERMLASEGAVEIGGDGPPRDEPIRFRHDPSLGFVTTDVTRARLVRRHVPFGDEIAAEHVEITTAFLGVTGSASPIPAAVTEEVLHEDEERSPRRDFLDMFHHRLVGLLYRGLARLSVDAEFRSDGSDAHSKRLLSLAGVDAHGAPRVHELADTDLLRLVPIAATRRGTRHAIEAALHVIFAEELGDARVHVKPLEGGFVPFDEGQKVRLAHTNSTLGVDAIIGRSVLHAAGKILVTIGPVGERVHRLFAPGGALAGKLREVLDFVVDGVVEVDVELELAEEARPAATLDRTKRLGLDSFLMGGRGRSRVRV